MLVGTGAAAADAQDVGRTGRGGACWLPACVRMHGTEGQVKRIVLACLAAVLATLLAGCAATVPDLRGLDKAQAEAVLERANLALGSTRHVWSSTVPTGQVVSQMPRPKTQARREARVTLSLSKGPEPARFAYDNLSFNRDDPLVGDEVVATVKVSNLGDLPGRAQVLLALDGRTVARRSLEIGGHASSKASLRVTAAQPGSHKVEIAGGPSASLVVRRWVLVANLSASYTPPKPLGGGRPYYRGMPAYDPDQLAKKQSGKFTLPEETALKLEWTVASGFPPGDISIKVAPPGRGYPDNSLGLGGQVHATSDGTKMLTRGPGTYWLEVSHEYCDWTVKAWAKR